MIPRLLLLSLLGFHQRHALAAPAPEAEAELVELEERAPKEDLSKSGWVVRHDLLQDIKNLEKRQNGLPPASICGYLYGSPDNPINCFPGVCGYNTNLNVFMCCSSEVVASGTTYPTGCPTVTSCVPSTALASCTGSCASNTLNTLCTDPAAPECAAATIAGVDRLKLTDFACLSTKTTVPVYLTTLDPAQVSSIALQGSSAPASPAMSSGKSSAASTGASPGFVLSSTTTSLPKTVTATTTAPSMTITTGPVVSTTSGTPTLSLKSGTAIAASVATTQNSNAAGLSLTTRLGSWIYAAFGMVFFL